MEQGEERCTQSNTTSGQSCKKDQSKGHTHNRILKFTSAPSYLSHAPSLCPPHLIIMSHKMHRNLLFRSSKSRYFSYICHCSPFTSIMHNYLLPCSTDIPLSFNFFFTQSIHLIHSFPLNLTLLSTDPTILFTNHFSSILFIYSHYIY